MRSSSGTSPPTGAATGVTGAAPSSSPGVRKRRGSGWDPSRSQNTTSPARAPSSCRNPGEPSTELPTGRTGACWAAGAAAGLAGTVTTPGTLLGVHSRISPTKLPLTHPAASPRGAGERHLHAAHPHASVRLHRGGHSAAGDRGDSPQPHPLRRRVPNPADHGQCCRDRATAAAPRTSSAALRYLPRSLGVIFHPAACQPSLVPLISSRSWLQERQRGGQRRDGAVGSTQCRFGVLLRAATAAGSRKTGCLHPAGVPCQEHPRGER